MAESAIAIAPFSPDAHQILPSSLPSRRFASDTEKPCRTAPYIPSTQLAISMAMVMGPTPPGTGVI